MTKPQLIAVHPVLGTRDVVAAIKFYSHLGFHRTFGGTEEIPDYAAIRRDAVELHLQWQGEDQWKYDIDRPTFRFVVDDVDGLHAEFMKVNLQLDITPVMNTSWETREFHLRDPDSNGLHFYRDLAASVR